MAKFAETYTDKEFVQQAAAQIPWGHNVAVLDKVSDSDARVWYINACRRNGWSRNVLIHQIESDLYARQAIADKVSNFERRLPAQQSEMAIQTMKDPYIFDFIPFRETVYYVFHGASCLITAQVPYVRLSWLVYDHHIGYYI